MESIPAASLVVIQAAFLFGIFVKLLDDQASMGKQTQARERGRLWQHTEPVFDLLFCVLLRLNRSGLWVISHRAFGQEPAFRSGVDARVAGAVQRGAGGPVGAQSHGLDLHRAFGSLSPADGVPGGRGLGPDQLFDRIRRCRTTLSWHATSPVNTGLLC